MAIFVAPSTPSKWAKIAKIAILRQKPPDERKIFEKFLSPYIAVLQHIKLCLPKFLEKFLQKYLVV